MWGNSYFDSAMDEKPDVSFVDETTFPRRFSARQSSYEVARINAARVFEVLQQDGPGFDSKLMLDEL